MLALVFVPMGYLLGSLPMGYFVSLWRGVRIQEVGSKSVGATNVARVLGWRYGILVILGDAAKSFLLVALAGWATHSAWIQAAALGAAMLGAAFPVFLRFKGGKGVVILAGGAVALLPILTVLILLLLWGSILLATRMMSLTNLVFSVIFMLFLLFFTDPVAFKLLGVGAALFLWYSHRENILRIIKRRESSLPLKF